MDRSAVLNFGSLRERPRHSGAGWLRQWNAGWLRQWNDGYLNAPFDGQPEAQYID
jgi:hypothetical protein